MGKFVEYFAAIVQQQFHMDLSASALFDFYGKKRDRITVLILETTGFVLLYKKLEKRTFQWSRYKSELKSIT